MSEITRIIQALTHTCGQSTIREPIGLHEPSFADTRAWDYVKDCLDTGWVSSAGEWVSRFEQALCNTTGAKYAIAVTNGTVALRLGLHLVGVKPGDEVLVPPLSFVATANAVQHLGATPHFVDIESGTLGMCPAALNERLERVCCRVDNNLINRETGRRIAAVMPVHVFGNPAEIKKLKALSQQWGLPLVEDQIESLPNGSMKDVLKMYYKDAESNIDVFKFNMESWFDNVMDRASGWYKRKIRVILILVGFLIATVFNVDTLEIFGRLQDQALANQLSELAGDLVASEATVEAIGLEALQAEFGKINLNELSIGWSEYTSGVKSFSSTNILMSFLGWIITALAISLGAPFWFDLLNKLVKFRGTGNTKDIIVVQNENRRSNQQHAVKVIEG